ncbi:MAG: putative porin [Candidatus Omnitrophota bacterium]
MRRFLTAIVLGGLISLGSGIGYTYAGEIDVLLSKLVEKGILSASEAQEIRTETNEEVARIEKQKDSLPDWVKNTKLKGDLRLRFQNKTEKTTGDNVKDTTVGRIRMRLGLETKINDKLLAGIGIASGSGDPRSTNMTFGDYDTKKTIVLDYGYAKYSPFAWGNFVGGKMLLPDALWEPTDLIWDTDITPEGARFQFNKSLGAKTTGFMNVGALIVDDDTSTDADGPMAYLAQVGAKYKVNDNISLKGAVSYQDFSNTKGHTSSQYSGASNTGNTAAGSSTYTYNYEMFNPALEVSVKEPFKALGLKVEMLKLMGEYVNNLDISSKKGRTGFSCGLKMGKEKVEKFGDWQFKYIFAMLGKDAVLDVLPDSDRYGGKTAMRSHEAELTFGLSKNTYLGVDVYRSWRTFNPKQPETLVQVDWNMKF